MRMAVEFSFHAAHRLPRHEGQCRNLHGHNYRLVVTLRGDVEEGKGMMVDFDQVKGIVHEQALSSLDRSYLNDLMENPTAENIVRWIWPRLVLVLPGLEELRLYETPDCAIIYRGE